MLGYGLGGLTQAITYISLTAYRPLPNPPPRGREQMVEITNSLNYQQCTPSPVGEGWGESKKTKGFPMIPCTKLIIKVVYKYRFIFRIGINRYSRNTETVSISLILNKMI